MKPSLKKLIAQPKVRLALLLSILAGVLILNLIAPSLEYPDDGQSIANWIESSDKRQMALSFYDTKVGRAKWEPSGDDIFVEVSIVTPVEVPVHAPKPPALASPPPAPEPVAPPLPYVAMAKFKSGEKSTLYLRAGNSTIPVSEGDLLGNGEYKIESISDVMVSIRYLPVNHLHELSLSGLE